MTLLKCFNHLVEESYTAGMALKLAFEKRKLPHHPSK